MFGDSLFRPATVQRTFEWEDFEAVQFLADIVRHSGLQLAPDTPVDNAELRVGAAAAPAGLATVAPRDLPLTIDDGPELTDRPNPHLLALAARREPGGTGTSQLDPPPGDVEPYFIGTVIFRPATRSDGRVEVFDGLQRLTVLTILFAALRDTCSDPNRTASLQTMVFDGETPRLVQTASKTAFQNRIQRPGGVTENRRFNPKSYGHAGAKMMAIAQAFRREIVGWSAESHAAFCDYLLSSVYAHRMLVSDPRMARQMFVSTNLHGRPLNVVDVLKGQLIETFSSATSTSDEAFLKQWLRLRSQFNDEFQEYLRVVDAVERRRPQGTAWETEFGAFVQARYAPSEREAFFGRMEEQAESWRQVKEIVKNAGLPGREPGALEENLYRLHVFKWYDWQPLALLWWHQVRELRSRNAFDGDAANRLQAKFDLLHRRCMAMVLTDLPDTSRETRFRVALQDEWAGRDVFAESEEERGPLSLTPTQLRKLDENLRKPITDPATWSLLVRWLEMSDWRPNIPELLKKGNCEHVLSRNQAHVAARDNAEHERLALALGNLAFISEATNAELANATPQEKLPALQRETSDYVLVRSVVSDLNGQSRMNWGAEEIVERTELLRQKVWRALGFEPPPE